MLLYWAFLLGKTVTRVVPLRASYGIARAVGLLTYVAWAGGRRRTVRNMLHVTGGDRRAARRLARASLQNYLSYLVDFFRLLSSSHEEMLARVHFDGWERVAAARRGRGVVAVTLHYGLWDLGASVLALHGVPVAAIADRFANARVDAYVVASREHLGMRIIPADRMGPGLIRALRNDEAVAVLVDIPAPESGIPVTFFGASIAVSDGPARLALRTGASVVAATVPRESPWSARARIEATAIDVPRTGDEAADARALMQAIFTHFEAAVRRDPAQWYIFRHLWPADRAGA